MDWKQEWKKLAAITAVFFACFYLPIGRPRFDNAIMESLHLVKWYAQEHVLLCLVPAFFIAGAISVFVSQASVMKYLGAKANKVLAYGVASISGSVLAVCSCTVLPLFAGIWRMGAGLGPATAFLYSGPAINVLAIILTARILGLEMGIARAVGAVAFSVIIGLIMHFIYRREELEKANGQMNMPEPQVRRPLWQNALFFAVMVGILVFANWGNTNDYYFKTADGQTFRATVLKAPEHGQAEDVTCTLKLTEGPDQGKEIQLQAGQIIEKKTVPGAWTSIWQHKWAITCVFAAGLAAILVFWFGVAWWKVVIAAIPVVVLAFVLPMDGMMVMIPFAAGAIGLSWMTSTTRGEAEEWFGSTWGFAKQILPLLFFGVLFSGAFLGRPGHEGLIPNKWVVWAVGGNSLWANFLASVVGAFMYFATLTEVPILQGLIGSGMGKGPALALLLAGPALSLPSMLVLRSIMGMQKTVVYCSLVVAMATVSGMIYGAFF
jgi:hypothetical protein